MLIRGSDSRSSGRHYARTSLLVFAVALFAGCGVGATHDATDTAPTSSSTVASQPTATIAATTTTTTTTVPCTLASTPGTANTVPIGEVCSSVGAPHFDTPQDAMTYLSAAWNTDDVRELDYVTDPAGRAQMDSMASLMVNLQFKSCTENPAGDYTCYFMHDIAPSTSPTTYPNPQGFPPGEAVFTVAPAAGPGWYLTEVQHCG